MRTNPNDPYGKVLIVAGARRRPGVDRGPGRGTAQRPAAGRADHHRQPASCPASASPTPRRAGRAPTGHRAVGLRHSRTAAGRRPAPLNVYFRIPPDIFYAERPNARPEACRIATTRFPSVPYRACRSAINNAFLGSVPLIPGQEARARCRPMCRCRSSICARSRIRSHSTSLSNCSRRATARTPRRSICRAPSCATRYLDLRGYPHYAPLPNLEIFANAGFPFTRYADLAKPQWCCRRLLPQQEIETFVTLMGHFGRQTGFPALRVTVAGPDAMHTGASLGLSGDRHRRRPAGFRQTRQKPSRGAAPAAGSRCMTPRASSLRFTTLGGSCRPTSTPSPAS